MPEQALIGLFSLAWLAVLIWLTHRFAARTHGWLTSCFACAFGYLALSLKLDSGGPTLAWLEGLRWALFGAALYSFVRYRIGRRREKEPEDHAQQRD
ncbi:MAG: hypothetical protein AAF358_25935 [Pseudomonadota bacterium]